MVAKVGYFNLISEYIIITNKEIGMKKEYTDIFMKVAKDVKKSEKGNELSTVLDLIQKVNDFQDTLALCVESLTGENKLAVEAFNDNINSMYDVLFPIAEQAVRAVRKDKNIMDEDGVQPEVQVEKPEPSSVPSVEALTKALDSKPNLTGAPKIHVPSNPKEPKVV